MAPNALAASTISWSTFRMPSSVRRTPGGSAKMIVAITPGTTPMPNSVTTGTSHTKAGIVCIRSMIGLVTALAARFRAAQIPSGIAIRTAITLATKTSANVCIAAAHCPMLMMSRNPSRRADSENPTPHEQPDHGEDHRHHQRRRSLEHHDQSVHGATDDAADGVEEPAEVRGEPVEEARQPARRPGSWEWSPPAAERSRCDTFLFFGLNRSWLGGLAAVAVAVWPCAARGPAAT